uniref:(northern house mosquito) hypothetical protein n=1 Tax=Culex pipiens TaxID=7175 RepID=A0A8D7ZYV2_CULPI
MVPLRAGGDLSAGADSAAQGRCAATFHGVAVPGGAPLRGGTGPGERVLYRARHQRGASPPAAAAAAKCLLGPHFQPAVHVPARFVRHGRVQPLSHHSSQQQQQRRRKRKRKQQQKETPKVSSGGRRLFRGGFRRCREWVIESAPEVAEFFPVTESRLEAFHGGTGRKWFETERFPEAGVVYFVEKVVPLPAVVK